MNTDPSPQIMTIDDEIAITESLRYTLSQAGFQVCTAGSLQEAQQLYQQHQSSLELIILDLVLPDGHGFDFLKKIRQSSHIPVMILSSHDDEIEHIVGLEIGADDYVDKPFSLREVVARVRSLLRRAGYRQANLETHSSHEPDASPHKSTDLITYHHQDKVLSIDSARHEVYVQQQAIQLSQIEFDLLKFLVMHKGVVHSRAQLLKAVWGQHITVNERTVDVHIKTVRKKMHQADLCDFIETIRGLGYKVVDRDV